MQTTTRPKTTIDKLSNIGRIIHGAQTANRSAACAMDYLTAAYDLGCREHLTLIISHPGVWRAMRHMTRWQVGEFILGEVAQCGPLFCNCERTD